MARQVESGLKVAFISDKQERYFDKLVSEYYSVLINAWDTSVRVSAKTALAALYSLGKERRANDADVKAIEHVIRNKMSNEFCAKLDEAVKTFTELVYRLSGAEEQFGGARVSFSPIDASNVEAIKQHNLFWLRGHYGDSVHGQFQEILQQSLDCGWTNGQLASVLQNQFKDTIKQGVPYFQGLAEHTSLRTREFSRLQKYASLNARRYMIVAVMDDRTSDICRALNGKIFLLSPAIQTMNAMISVNEYYDYDEAKEHLKQLSPFMKDSDVQYAEDGVTPMDVVHGVESPFPPFHWRCRSRTVMVLD